MTYSRSSTEGTENDLPGRRPACAALVRWARRGLLGLLVLVAGCTGLTDEEPPVADSTMVDVLIELHLRDARLKEYGDLPAGLQDSLYRRYGVTREEYEAALDYYAFHPEAYTALYDSITGHLRQEIDTVPTD